MTILTKLGTTVTLHRHKTLCELGNMLKNGIAIIFFHLVS